ncbi:DUF6402 family protein [Paraburkholderia tuberum]|uniref:DUF6402 family protein n=1 Tax=Paraburkholderia tuberum TaxID=157910 RepID=UPI00115F954C|nr:DUF6402 family protein [Paraburkholderia tuberum]
MRTPLYADSVDHRRWVFESSTRTFSVQLRNPGRRRCAKPRAVAASSGKEGHTRVAEISGIYVYIKDSYDFTDKPGEASQYLGHWSKNGVIVLAYNGAMSYLNEPRLYFSYPVALGNPKVRGNVYYPLHNKDFREWAIKHQRGGDFLIYSDRKIVRIDPPIKVYL